jgi:hypothetical protein
MNFNATCGSKPSDFVRRDIHMDLTLERANLSIAIILMVHAVNHDAGRRRVLASFLQFEAAEEIHPFHDNRFDSRQRDIHGPTAACIFGMGQHMSIARTQHRLDYLCVKQLV